MIVPSLQENLSNAIMESLACGTPVVGFDIGGNADMIEHQQTGYLVKPFDTDDLANGIEWVLHVSDYDELCNKAREKVVREFDSIVVAKKYIELYESILNA
jgi:glycosyltransferase involved in cell wall biosynthesis